jgi:hypothetical protein
MIGLTFPVTGSEKRTSVPWNLVEPHRAAIEKTTGRTLQFLAAHGGLPLLEIAAVIGGESCDDAEKAEALVDEHLAKVKGGTYMKHLGKIAIAGLIAAALCFAPRLATAQSVSNLGASATSSSATSASVALPASTKSFPALLIVPDQSTTVNVNYALGASNITASASNPVLPTGGLCILNVGPATTLAVFAATGTGKVNLTQMTSCAQFAGGTGSSGGGGGGAVTIANGADTAEGSTTDSAANNSTNAWSVVALLKGLYNQLSALITAVQSSIPAGTNVIGALVANQSVNLTQIGGATASVGAGAVGTGTLRVAVGQDTTTIAGSAPGTAGTPSTQVLSVQGVASGTPQPMSLNTTPTVANGNGVVPSLVTSGGYTTYFLQPAASDNHTNVKNGAGQVYWILAENNSATVNYLRFYNAASGFNGCGSATNLIAQIQIPASTSVGGINIPLPFGIPFSTGISICVTSGYATNDTTNATASAMSLTIGYN